MCLLFYGNSDHRDLHVFTHPFPPRRSSGLADVGPDFAARRAGLQSLAGAFGRGFIVAAIAGVIDEFGLVDDAVNLLMLAHEAEEGSAADAFGLDLVGRGLKDRGHMVAQLLAHIADERLEDFLFRIQIGLEDAERGPPPPTNSPAPPLLQ